MRHLLKNKSDEYVIRFLALRIHARLDKNCFGLIPYRVRLRIEFV